MEASFIEIYNETLRDLLATGRKDKIVKHEIRMDSKNHGEVYVTNITPVVISSEQQACTKLCMYMYICTLYICVHVLSFILSLNEMLTVLECLSCHVQCTCTHILYMYTYIRCT